MLLPIVILSQSDSLETKLMDKDSLYKLNKSVLSIGFSNNSYESDLSLSKHLRIPQHLFFGANLSYTQPLNNVINLDLNAGYHQIGDFGYSEIDKFKGTFSGADLSISFKLPNATRVIPYFGLGFGMAYFNTSKDSLSANGEAYYKWDDGTIRNLPEYYQSWQTVDEIPVDNVYETQISKGFSFYIPYTIGVRFKLSPKFTTGISYTYNLVSSKHDGVPLGLDGIHQFRFSFGYVCGLKNAKN